MFTARKANVVADQLWILGLAIVLPVVAMLLLGLDTNYDLRNYHLYNVHAWFTGRMDTDIAPAHSQSWHNPLLDVPLYLFTRSGLSARWISAWLTLPAVVTIFLLLRLQELLSQKPPSRISQLVLALLALTGAAAYSTLATSMDDWFAAAAILTSLLLVLNYDHEGHALRRWLLAGLVAGAITGLKLTAIFYCCGLAFSALVGGQWKEKCLRLCSLAVGGTIGFGLTYGYWGWRLFMAHRNPFFPYYNNIFRSPDVLANTFADVRFRANSLLDALLIPAQLLHSSTRFSEFKFSDPRLLIGLLSLLGLYALRRKNSPEGSSARNRIGILLVFFISSFLLWAVQYGIYRYAIALELLGCLAFVVVLQWLPRWRNTTLLVAALLISADTQRPDWGHVQSTAPRFGITQVAIPGDSLVVIADQEPVAYLALGLPANVPLIAVSNNLMSPEICTKMQMRTKAMISDHQGPIWRLSSAEAGAEHGQSIMAQYYGLQAAGACTTLTSSLGTARLCPQRRIAAPSLCEGSMIFRVTPATMKPCGPGVVSEIKWNLKGSASPTANTQIWVGAAHGTDMKLFSEGGPAGTEMTGPWNVPGVRYLLKSKDSGETLASATVHGPACPSRP